MLPREWQTAASSWWHGSDKDFSVFKKLLRMLTLAVVRVAAKCSITRAALHVHHEEKLKQQ